MRWEQQRVALDDQDRLPGYGDVTVRHFDAPEAIDTRFYEVRAKSILNRVPPASRMPFRWTINPYRGCTHACKYCLAGETSILMADGRTRAIRDLRVGDAIVGTVREGRNRRFVQTEVLAHWSSIRQAFRIALEDGTELLASEDHRFLTRRGWKHVLGRRQGRLRRPHLTLSSELLGPGGHATPPARDPDYMRGYLCGIVRGDANLGTYRYDRPGRANADVHRFRLALADFEALDRSYDFLAALGVTTTEFQFAAAAGPRREIRAIRTSAGSQVDRIRRLIEWPLVPSQSWVKGFLAGIFDAEGSCSQGVWRVFNTDSEIIRWVVDCMRLLDFDCIVERSRGPVKVVRLRGGIRERMRFFLTTDPAITHKRGVIGSCVKNPSPNRVVSISPTGMVMRMYDITTGTGDFIANGVISHNCFARPTHEYLDFDAGRDFEREIVVKVNAPERLRVELARRSWRQEHVALGTNTDPYQWVEGRYQLMPEIWKAFRDTRNPCSILTKSPLLLRDLPLMRELDAVTDFSAALSIPTLDPSAWRATEPRSPNPQARVEAIAELTRAGIRTGVLVAPLMPGINDAPEQIEEVVRLASEAGASYIIGIPLHLRGSVREVFMTWLATRRPDLIETYEELYRRGAYLPVTERQRIAKLVDAAQLTAGPAPGPAAGDRALETGERPWRMRRGEGSGGDPPRPQGPDPPRLF
jgi:DNA repair photolyase